MEHCTVHSKLIDRKPHSIDIEMNWRKMIIDQTVGKSLTIKKIALL